MKKLFSILLCASILTTSAAVTLPAQAEYPNKPVQFIVPWPPGDMEDVLTRMIAEDLQKATGRPAAVVNKQGKGAGPFPGAVEVAKAAPEWPHGRVIRDWRADCQPTHRHS